MAATTTEILATIKGLKARARKMPASVKTQGHFQIAKRAISNAVLFAERNTEYAESNCWTARHHLNMIGVD